MDQNNDEEHDKWLEEQKKIKSELMGLLTEEVKEEAEESAKAQKPEDEDLFEKAMAKVTGEDDLLDEPAEDAPAAPEDPKPPEPKEEPKPPEPEEEPKEEPKPPKDKPPEPEDEPDEAPTDEVRELPKPKGLANKLGKVLAHEKGDKPPKPDEPEDDMPKQEIPKPKGLADKLGKVMAHEKKPESEKKKKKVDISKYVADDVIKAGKDAPPPPKEEPKSKDDSVKEMIEHTEGLIVKAPEHIDLSRPKKLVRKAKDALTDGDHDEAIKLAQEAKEKIVEIRNDFINAKKLLKQSKDRLLSAKSKGFNISKAKSHYQMALKLLKKNDHIMSMQYAKLCLREIERNEMGI